MWVKAIGAALGLALGAGAVGAEDRAATLQAIGAQVTDLATGWEPDLHAAVQGFSDQDLGFGRRAPVDPVDPWRAYVVSVLPGEKGAEISFGAVSCVRMGAETLRFYAENVDLTNGPPRLLPGRDPEVMQDVRVSEAGFLTTLGKGWLGPQPQGAEAVLSCTFSMRSSRPMDAAALAGLAQGLEAGFDGVEMRVDDPGPMTGFIRFVPLVSVAGSKDPLTRLGAFEFSRIEQEGVTSEGQELVLSFTVWRMGAGS